MTSALDTEIKAALDARKGEWKAIAEGSGISYSWLSKFVNGHIPNPGYATLVAIADHLGLFAKRGKKQAAAKV